MAGVKGRSGRKPSASTIAIREIVNDPACFEAVRQRARTDPVFFLQLYQQIHGRPAQALSVDVGARDDSRFVAVYAEDDSVSTTTALPLPEGPPS